MWRELAKVIVVFVALAVFYALACWLTLKLIPWQLHWLKLMIPSLALATPHLADRIAH
ncbi:hypothetical protein J3L11_14105 [Shewanella sp. 4t3-1-2LB]|uniref:hypothetical protein n=1 Tax=Shewanella sp. 4t3-1-2LB TaxID=2817682 RepID=UPI001A99A815|nr:hypothetical protein [Shewanella sp. 4t3-1-2LB]MBO1272775.1 hypothetical protein [Shewanella sp. 4t3-1-2LB]